MSTKTKSPSGRSGHASPFMALLTGLRRKKIIEILAGFIGGGWLILEFVHWILIDHYHLPEGTLDVAFVTLVGALLYTLLWRAWAGSRKAPGKIRPEFIALALVLLVTVFIDVRLILKMRKYSPEPPGGPEWEKSVAVLPLHNDSNDPGQEYFSDGMTEALITELSRIKALRVISRQSVMQFKGSKEPLPEIARRLNVESIIEGSVLRAGDQVRITAQLIKAKPEQHIWSQHYTRDLKDILNLQSEVAGAIAQEIKVVFTPEDKARLEQARLVNLEAYDAYLKGRSFMYKLTEADIKKGIDYFNQALAQDPKFALAYSGLAEAYGTLTVMTLLQPKQGLPLMREHVEKALEIDETLSEAHMLLGDVKLYMDWDWPGAEKEYKRAITLNPNSASARIFHANYLMWMGRNQEAVQEGQKAVDLDPLMPAHKMMLAYFYMMARDYDRSLKMSQESLTLDPTLFYAHINTAGVYFLKGMYEEARVEVQGVLRMIPDFRTAKILLASIYDRKGQRDQARQILDEFVRESEQKNASRYLVAEVYGAIGENDKALDWLEKAYQARDYETYQVKSDFFFEKIRSDPRYQALLKKMNLDF